jgi:hypothetical protein
MTPEEQAFLDFLATEHQGLLTRAGNLAATNAGLRLALEAKEQEIARLKAGPTVVEQLRK